MDAFQAIENRRSIRKYQDKPVSKEGVTKIIQAGMLAPSAKNRQPWRFVVSFSGEARTQMCAAMSKGLDYREATASSPDEQKYLKGARYTLGIMERAPVTIFILNPHGKDPSEPITPYGERFMDMANVQSIGACIQNMCVEATELGLGTLWIADVYDAYHTLGEWMGTQDLLVAALSIGWPDEAPNPRGRKSVDDVTTWR